jgi:hypothetical protein
MIGKPGIRVRLTELAHRAILARASQPADAAIVQPVGDQERAERVTALLEEFARLLL